MAFNDIPVEGQAPPAEWWRDVHYLQLMADDLGKPSMPDRDGMDAMVGVYPRQEEPRWLLWLTVVCCMAAALSIPVVIYTH